MFSSHILLDLILIARPLMPDLVQDPLTYHKEWWLAIGGIQFHPPFEISNPYITIKFKWRAMSLYYVRTSICSTFSRTGISYMYAATVRVHRPYMVLVIFLPGSCFNKSCSEPITMVWWIEDESSRLRCSNNRPVIPEASNRLVTRSNYFLF